ncbi:CYTH domain-containing protein [Paenibacillus sp. D2_2]|uniref:CYTH domain-containing protein n=1 Tax=Paenibacillus sp. D2_2 TaxID=3073092 RepID=UPI002816611D|nr:CYTH domain-containing protein [Paenibacillus sp. D2_2]WMT43418.1 CYTH domain-containing protein [Paenibacillus sp. D2_2]
MSLEIERKFLLPKYPAELIQEGALVIVKEQMIDQTYLALHEDQELRVRKIKDLASGEVTFTHTFKRGFGLTREEVEYSISEGLYEQMIEAHGTIPLIKKRTTAQWNDHIVEIDEYDQIQMKVLEVEFTSEEEALRFLAPDWFGPDISTEKKYSNKKVWRELQTQRD